MVARTAGLAEVAGAIDIRRHLIRDELGDLGVVLPSLWRLQGFVEFRLLRGKSHAEEGFTLFSSHTVWRSEEDFQNWTKSENFRMAHRNAGDHKGMYLGPPVFEGFNVVEGI